MADQLPEARPRSRRTARAIRRAAVAGCVLAVLGVGSAPGRAAPQGARLVGWQSFLRLDLLPYLQPGVSTFQVSSADPTDADDDGYSGAYSCVHRVAQGCLVAAHDGPGELESVWSAGNQTGDSATGGRLLIELDGAVVVAASWPQLVSGARSPFLFPLALGPNESWGASSINLPMPFRHEMRVISQFNPHYIHVVYRTFSSPQGIAAWRPTRPVPPGVLNELRGAGTRDPKPAIGRGSGARRHFRLAARGRLAVITLHGSGAISRLRVRFTRYAARGETAAAASAEVFGTARLLITFDGRRTVDAPLGEFFGSGLGPTRVRALLFAMDGGPFGWATAWWPMPFAASAQITIANPSDVSVSGDVEVQWARSPDWRSALGPAGTAGYFHAQGHSGRTQRDRYWTLLRTRGSGTFVGVTMTMLGGYPPVYLEGNERAYVDGAGRPQIQGTGTEDFFGGGWYFFDDRLFTLPLTGFTAHSTDEAGCPAETCKTAYRLMVADAVPFRHSILYEIQHGTRNLAPATYSSTAYWYQRR